METETQNVVISGYYGFGNSGDEAVLQSIIAALDQESEGRIRAVVLSSRPQVTQEMYGVQAVNRMELRQVAAAIRHSAGVISGGGSLLQDATGLFSIPYYLGVIRLAGWLGKPVFIYAQGIGPVRRRIFYPFIRGAFHRAAYVSVRDQESANVLGRMNVRRERIHVVPDPVMGVSRWEGGSKEDRPALRGEPDEPVIGVSIRFWRQDRTDLDKLAAALRLIAERRRSVRFVLLPFHLPADREASEYVLRGLLGSGEAGSRFDIAEDTSHPQQMLKQVSECSLIVGMRLHALIYAASQWVPMVGISYDPKIDAFLHRLQMQPVGSTDDLNPKKVAEETIRLLDGREQWIATKQAGIEELRKESRLPAQQIIAYLRNKG